MFFLNESRDDSYIVYKTLSFLYNADGNKKLQCSNV
ncbi:hypothetical protein SAMN05421821_101723 [Mucilaginibacter lappiensis]|uniref:Uncharacterized protein n=1 Tax=Mucilaginibacter lappiensis TaxID=354630 RepID=A0A1N6Q3Z2_9SPHI|nr:hypothetical protein [Mucilaginibacter lappiensis]MBB6126327.1 hypothetical protein [Mucilaginibacter lappiensis]SIQ11303.1 hypothetical protein SAMN05421821_101723 [Mucilaginibacter lappiensis]